MKNNIKLMIASGVKTKKQVLDPVENVQNRTVVQIDNAGGIVDRDKNIPPVVQTGNIGIMADKNKIIVHKRVRHRLGKTKPAQDHQGRG